MDTTASDPATDMSMQCACGKICNKQSQLEDSPSEDKWVAGSGTTQGTGGVQPGETQPPVLGASVLQNNPI